MPYPSVATDALGIATTSTAVNVTAIANVPPAVSLTGPANGATVKVPGSFTLTADAASTTSAIAKVDFYAIDNATNAGTLIGTAIQTPYTTNWSNVPLGSYTLSAVATDTLNATTTSTPVTVTVNTGIAQAYYIHTDHLDSPRSITDTAGNIVWQWDNTDPFGNNVPNENPSGLGTFVYNQRFVGQYFDKETGLHYNFHRDYDPALGGRYIESDPIGLAGGINGYVYANQNPLIYTDPLGLYGWSDLKHDIRDATGGCSNQSFANDVMDNFANVEDASSLLKTGTSLGLGGAFAKQYGGLTFGGAAVGAWKEAASGFEVTGIGSRTFAQAAATTGATWAINAVLIKGSFDAGMLVGSVVRTAINRAASSGCECQK